MKRPGSENEARVRGGDDESIWTGRLAIGAGLFVRPNRGGRGDLGDDLAGWSDHQTGAPSGGDGLEQECLYVAVRGVGS